MRTVLILAYYFPPMGLGGVQRVLKFVKYLPRCGWRPLVVTVKDVHYYNRDETLLEDIPPEAEIYRTGSLDPLRLSHLLRLQTAMNGRPGASARGRSLARWLLVPDHQIGWAPFAVRRAARLIRSERVDAIFSTFPPASGHLAGLWLHAATGKPWVADFRDAWIGGEFEQTPTAFHRALQRRLHRMAVRRATRVVAVSEGIAQTLSVVRGDRVPVVENGYDPDDFAGVSAGTARRVPTSKGAPFTLTYCGTLNRARNPEPLFRTLRRLLDRRPGLASRIRVRLVGAAPGLDIPGMLRRYRIEDTVTLTDYRAHREAVAEMVRADALTVLISTGDAKARDVPTGKIYECLAAGRPVLAIAPNGAAQALLTRFDRGVAVPPDDVEGIADVLERWIRQHEAGSLPSHPVNDEPVRVFSRLHLTERLAGILDDACNASE